MKVGRDLGRIENRRTKSISTDSSRRKGHEGKNGRRNFVRRSVMLSAVRTANGELRTVKSNDLVQRA